ncbi:MAG: hypothetical protein K8F36_02755 [Melioribacteraceae bacterium]|nr:hypothetical protein [Melioribacteraceae bacterium]
MINRKFSFTRLLCVVFLLTLSTSAQEKQAKKIIILPFESEVIDKSTLITAEFLLRQEIRNKSKMVKLFSAGETTETIEKLSCPGDECLKKIGTDLNADEIVKTIIMSLGEKLIVHFEIYNVDDEKIVFSDRVTTESVEELDVVMTRIAASIVEEKSIRAVADIGNIVEDESKEDFRRSGSMFWGLSFGYFYPLSNFPNDDPSFTMDAKFGADVDNLEYGVQFFAREGFGVNIFSSILASTKDFAPYLGLGLGFHWLKDQSSFTYIQEFNDHRYVEKKGDGFEAIINGGFRLFNTYKFRLTVNLAFSHTFNEMDNNSFTLTIGFLR